MDFFVNWSLRYATDGEQFYDVDMMRFTPMRGGGYTVYAVGPLVRGMPGAVSCKKAAEKMAQKLNLPIINWVKQGQIVSDTDYNRWKNEFLTEQSITQ